MPTESEMAFMKHNGVCYIHKNTFLRPYGEVTGKDERGRYIQGYECPECGQTADLPATSQAISKRERGKSILERIGLV